MLKTIKKGFLAVALAFVTLFALASCNIFGTTTADPSQAANTALTEFTAQVTFPNLNETKADFNLPIAGVKGSYNIPITWTSSDPTIIQITDLIENGATSLKYKLAKVTKPATDTKVVLTADFSLTYTKADGTTATLKAQKTFTFNVVGGGSGSGSGSGEVPTVPGALTLTLDFNTNATTWLDKKDNVSTTEKTFEASGITFGYKAGYGSSYDGKSFMMLAKGQNPSLYNKTALPGEIVSVSVVVPTGSSESAIYHLDLFAAENNGNITSSNTLTGPGTLTATAQASQGFKYFNISKAQTGDDPSKDKNGQIIQIVINYMPPQKADADKVAEDKEALTLPASTEGNVTLPTTGTNGSTITWEVKEGSSAMTNAGVVTRGATDVTVKLTATITSGTEKQTKDFTIVVKAKYAAVEGVAAVDKNNTYKLVINQAATEQVLWLNGLVEDRFAATTLDKEAAAVFHLEETTGGYHIYTTDGTTKKYLCITTVQQGTETKKKVDFAATSNVAWVWNATHKTMTTTFNSQELFLGTYSTFKTASYNEIAEITEDGTYVLQFVLDTGTTPELSDKDKVAADKAELLTKLPAEVTADFQLPTQGTLGSAITWAVKTGQGITIEGNTAKVTQTDTAQIVVLTATVQLGGATETQEVSVTIKAAEQTGGEDPDTPTAGQVVITSDKLVQNAAASGYDQYAGAQNFDGVACNITDIMKNKSDLQFKKNTGEIKNTAALAKNITEVILVVQSGKAISLSVGATAGALTAVTLPAADTTTKTGYDIYTCVIEAGNVFFKVANTSSNESYLESITIKFGDSATTPTEKTPEQKVAEVKAYLTAELGKLTLTDVTADITLPTSSLADVTVVWASNNPTVVANDGKVTRPAYNADPATAKATLTATISCGETAKATLTQDVTVKLKEATDEEKVADAKTELQTAVTNLGTSTTLNPTTSSLQLPATVSNGATVTWAITEGSNYASLDGTTAGLLKVTEANRPAWNAANDATVKLTATIKSNVEENKEVTVTVTINKKVATDADKVADAKTQLQELVNDLTNKVLNETTSTVKLPADAINGATITWAADADTYVTVDANGLVTLKENALPAWNAENGKVVLTATIQLNEADKKEVTVEITVEKKQPTTKDLLDDAAAALELTGVNLEAVTQNVTLPTSGNNETKIAWVSDKPAVVANDGTVTRPTFGQGAATVKLTATLTIEGKEGTATKEFTLTVPEAAQTDDAKIAEAKSALDTQITALNKALAVGTDALTLPSQPTNGAAIKYEVTAGEAYVKVEEGKVVVIARPEYKEAAATATITATVSCGNGTAQTATIELTIDAKAPTAKQQVEDAVADLDVPTEIEVATGFTLPIAGSHETVITWASSNESLATVDNTTGAVTIINPAWSSTGSSEVTLTATVTSKDATASDSTIKYTFNVTKAAATKDELLAAEKEALELSVENKDNVTEATITLPATAGNGVTVAWASSSEAIIALDGTVTKPSYTDCKATDGKKVVTLTATLSLEGATNSLTKTFDLTVYAAPATPDELLAEAHAALTEDSLNVEDITAITESAVKLTETGLHNVTITWVATPANIDIATGKITKPLPGAENLNIKLTATLSLEGATDLTKDFDLTIVAPAPIDNIADALVAEDGSKVKIKGIVSKITYAWNDTNMSFVITDGENSIAIHKSISQVNQYDYVEVSGSYAKEHNNIGSDPSATILTPSTDEEKLLVESVKLIDKIMLKVKTSYELPVTGENEIGISWESNNTAIAINGKDATVTQATTDTVVELTATLSLGGKTRTVKFDVTVVALPKEGEPSLVLTSAELLNGSKFYIVNVENGIAMADHNSGDYRNQTEFKVDAVGQSALIELVTTETAGIFLLKVGENTYLSLTSDGNKLYTTTTDAPGDDYKWKITINADCTATIVNVKYATRMIRYNKANTRFACYKSGQLDVSLFIYPIGYTPVKSVEERLNEDANELSIDSNISAAISLPSSGEFNGSAIKWESTNPAITIDSAGVMTVIRPAIGQADATGKLTATLTLEGKTTSVEFDVTVPAKEQPATLVTNVSELANGAQIYITNKDATLAMADHNSGDYRNQTEFKVDAVGQSALIELVTTETAGVFLLKVGENTYLSLTSDGNKLYTTTTDTPNDDYKWKITVEDSGVATITSVSYNNRSIKYNPTSPRFACYKSGQQTICIYLKPNQA